VVGFIHRGLVDESCFLGGAFTVGSRMSSSI
jgi:hypothetical protein